MTPTRTGSEQTVCSGKRDPPRWRPLPVDGPSPLTAVPAVISLLLWPALRLLVESQLYLFRRLRRR